MALLLAQLAFGLLAMTICIPSMQEWGAIFAAPQSRVQLTFSAYVVAYGGLQLLYGPLSDRHGRKQVLLAGLAVALLGSVLAALSPSLGLLTLARLLQGAGAAAGMVVGRAMVQDLFQGPERTRVMAWVGMAMGLCPPAATIVGGQLHVRLGWQANFWLMAALAAVLWVAAWRGLPDKVARRGDAPATNWLADMGAAYARLARERRFLLYVSVLSMTTATFYAFLGGAPLVLKGLGVGPDRVGFFIMAIPLSYIVGNYATTHLVRRVGERRIMAAGQALTLMGIALLLAIGLGGGLGPLGFALPLTLLGLGHGLLVPAALAGTVGLIPALAGSAAAVTGLMQQLLGAGGGYVVGWLPHDNQAPLAAVMLALAGLGALAQWGLHASGGRVTRCG